MSLQNPFNCYTCTTCGGQIVTVDRDEGVTPFMVRCRAQKDCGGTMHSSFYTNVPLALQPTYEWRKPTPQEYRKLDKATRTDHVDRGGLLMYRLDGAAEEMPARPERSIRSIKTEAKRQKAERKERIRTAKVMLGGRLNPEEMAAIR
jgi:hypothetical protein